MANDLLKKLEEKINEAIETIELSRMEVSELKEQNDELENRYADWEIRLSTLIEKFEQLEDSENDENEEELNATMQASDADIGDEVEASEETSNTKIEAAEEDIEDEVEASEETSNTEIEAAEEDIEDEIESADTLYAENEDLEDSYDEEELGSTFDTSADSFNESTESSQQYA